MAGVTINIPNIGNVVAENAASEETLLKLLAAIQKQQSGGSRTGGKDEKDLKKAREDETQQIKAGNEALAKQTKLQSEQTKNSDATGKSLKNSFNNLKNSVSNGQIALDGLGKAGPSLAKGFSQIGDGMKQAWGGISNTLKTFGSTAVTVATSLVTSYESMAKDPIGAAATMMATNIDLAGVMAKGAVDVLTGGLKAAGGLLGPFSGAVGGAADALSAAAKAAIDFATSVLKIANDVMAKEFQKSANMLKDFSKSGASFAGGMLEMRNIAHDSGVMMDTFSGAVKGSTEEIRTMGLTQGEGAKALAQGMKSLSTTVGKSGGTLRDEMLAMGYSYEEQGQIVAQLGAQMKSSGQDIRNLAPSELARQTKDYATNLKVISDITGQDAKKLQEKARAESMRGAIMGKLDADQQKAFKDAHATLMTLGPEAGPKMQQALMQMLAGGTVTDPVIAGNAEAMEMIKKTASQIQSGNVDMVVETQKSTAEFANAVRANGETATSTAALMSSSFSGVGKDMATFGDSIRAFSNLETDAAEKSKQNAVKQSEATDQVTKGYTEITASMTKFGVEMEKFTSEHLDSYAKLLRQNAEMTMKALGEALKVLDKGVGEYAKEKAAEAGVEPDKAGNALKGAAAGAATGAAIGALAGPVGAAVGGVLGGLVGGAAGYFHKPGQTLEEDPNQPNFAGAMADGGVVKARPGGAMVLTAEAGKNEAFVPLPNGKSIPVEMKGFGDLASAMSGMSDNEPLISSMGAMNGQVVSAFSQVSSSFAPMTQMLDSSTNELMTGMTDISGFMKGMPAEIASGHKEMLTGISSITNSFEPVTQKMIATNAELAPILEKLSMTLETMVASKTEDKGIFGTLASHLEELKNTAVKQLDHHDTMSKLMADQKDLAQGLLNNSY